MIEQRFPEGWDLERVQKLIAHYDNLSDDELAAEHEAALEAVDHTWMAVPNDLVPAVRALIAKKTA